MNEQSTNQAENTSASINVGDVLSGIWNRKSWVVVTTILAAIGSVAFVATATPEYQATARILVENQETEFSRTAGNSSRANAVDQQEVVSQVEIMYSRDLAKKVIGQLNLTQNPEFDSKPGMVKKLLISRGLIKPTKETAVQRALKAYYKKLTAYQIPLSKVIVINMKSTNPRVAAKVANTLGEVFVSDTRSVQRKTTSRARDWLAQQIDQLRKKVIETEVAAEKFRAKAGLLKGRGQNTTLSSQELSELNTQIILAEANRSEIQARAKAIRNLLSTTGDVSSSAEVLKSQLIQRLRERQITLKGNVAELSTTYLPNHPRIASVRREIIGLTRQIRSEALKIVAGLEQQAKVATAREGSLRASLNGLKTKASGTNLDEVKLRSLEREAKANRTLLETFLTKFSDASAREDAQAQPGLARIISKADVPLEPSFPKPVPTILLATIGGMVLSMGIAFMAAVMGAVSGTNISVSARKSIAVPDVPTTVAETQYVATPTAPTAMSPMQPMHSSLQTVPPFPGVIQSVPVPAATPISVPPVPMTTPSLSQLPTSTSLQLANANALTVLQNINSEFANGLAPIVSWTNSARQTLGVKRLAIIGMPGAELDTAATCLGLARSLAAQNIRTIIVDVAMHGSQLAAMTGTENSSGISELLTGYASFMDVIVKDDYSNARIMRVGQQTAAAWPLLASDRMDTVLSALDSDDNHDVIIIHGGALANPNFVDNPAIAKSHSALLMVSASQTAMAGNALQSLNAIGMRSSQYVRVVDGGGLHQTPDNVTHLNAAHIANGALQGQTPAAGQPTMNAPLFPKVAV